MNKKYIEEIEKIKKDIKDIKIQGATNLARAVVKGIRIIIKHYRIDTAKLKNEIIKVGKDLSLVRENEPLARNFVKYLSYRMNEKNEEKNLRDIASRACDEYLALIEDSKLKIVEFGTKRLIPESVILTHCHSSTAVNILKNVSKLKSVKNKKFKVVATETRPLYQGRETAKELYEAGVDVTLIVDSACASFIIDDKHLPVGSVIVGCDELFIDGSFINKVGTYSIALAAKKAKDELFVATSLLKLNIEDSGINPRIEQRDASEVWKESPKGLKIINSAFEKVDAPYVTEYMTEAGVIKSGQLLAKAKILYPWLCI